jgi:hypothetical protein
MESIPKLKYMPDVLLSKKNGDLLKEKSAGEYPWNRLKMRCTKAQGGSICR